MKRLSKVILISATIIVVLLVAAFVGVVIYARSGDARAQIEDSLTKALKTQIRITSVDLTPWRELRAEGVSIPATTEGVTPLVVAPSFRASYRFWPLLRGELQLHSLTLDEPHLVWAQNAEERWVWPTIEKKATEPKEPKTSEPKKKSTKTVTVSGLRIANGTIEMLDSQRQPIIVGTEANADFTDLTDGVVAGTVSFAKLVWNNSWVLENAKAKFRYTKGTFSLQDLIATSFGGEVAGSLEISTESDKSPFTAHLELKGVDLNQLALAAGWSGGDIGGKLTGKMDVTGNTKKLARLEGPGQLTIEDGHLRKLELFESLAQVLAFPELANLQPRLTTAEFQLRDEKAFVDSLVLDTGNLKISSKGVAKFDGKLSLDSQLAVAERAYKTLPEFAARNFTRQDDGQYALDFKITGRTNAPKTDLAERLIGGSFKDKVEDLLGGLFGTKSKDKPEEKPKEKKDKKKPAPDSAKATDSNAKPVPHEQ